MLLKMNTETYFEIKENGEIEISLNANSGYAKYDSENIAASVYYTEDKVILAFYLISGNYTFPGDNFADPPFLYHDE